jgi:CheY-like chemotaxis protein
VFLREPYWLLVSVVGLVAGKALVLTMLGRLFRLSWPAAIESSLLLGPVGEFAFVSIGMAAALGLLEPRVSSFAVAVTATTMALTPLLALLGRRLAARLSAERAPDPELAIRPSGEDQQAIVIGHGRVGKVVCSLLAVHEVGYIAVDHEAAAVARDRRDGQRDLRAQRFVMDFAQSAADALSRISNNVERSLILILSDISMPGMTGLEMLPKAKAIRPEVPVIMVTAYGEPDTRRKALENGATGLLTKPIDFALLRQEIDTRPAPAA